MTEEIILKAIPSSEPADFGEFCGALGEDKPTERGEWSAMFRILDALERDGYVEIERTRGNIDTLILTESGAARVRQSR